MVRVAVIQLFISNNFTVNLKEFADPDWDSDIPSIIMSVENIPGPYYQNIHTMFKFTKKSLEDMFFNASDSKLSWFTKEGISEKNRFIQIKLTFYHPLLKKIEVY